MVDLFGENMIVIQYKILLAEMEKGFFDTSLKNYKSTIRLGFNIKTKFIYLLCSQIMKDKMKTESFLSKSGMNPNEKNGGLGLIPFLYRVLS